MGLLSKFFRPKASKEEQQLNAALDTAEERLLTERAHREIPLPSSQTLSITLNPGQSPRKRAKALAEILTAAAQITQSVDPSGRLTERFGAVADPDHTSLGLACFTSGLEAIEMAAVRIRAQLIALRHGVEIVGIDETHIEAKEKCPGARRIIGVVNLRGRICRIEAVVSNHEHEGLSQLSPKAALLLGFRQVLREQTVRILHRWENRPEALRVFLKEESLLRSMAGDWSDTLALFISDPQQRAHCFISSDIAYSVLRRTLQSWLDNPEALRQHLAKLDTQTVSSERIQAAAKEAETAAYLEVHSEERLADNPRTSIICSVHPLP